MEDGGAAALRRRTRERRRCKKYHPRCRSGASPATAAASSCSNAAAVTTRKVEGSALPSYPWIPPSHRRFAASSARAASSLSGGVRRGIVAVTPARILLAPFVGLLLAAAGIAEAQSSSEPTSEPMAWWEVLLQWLAVFLLVCSSALFSGLTLGLLGLDKIGLEIVVNSGDPRLSVYARRIQPLRNNGNLLLCTLLLGNVATNALMSILLAGLTSEIVGFLLSTTVITLFGEIIPQAVCSRHALYIGSRVVPIVKVIMFFFYPICKPLSMALDWALGEELGTIHTRTELRELLNIHVQHGALDVETGRELDGALHYKERRVGDCMTPMDKVFMLEMHERLHFETVSKIFREGYSRIPVYNTEKNNIIGLLFTKDLIFIDPEDQMTVQNFLHIFGRGLQLVWPDMKLGEVMSLFKKNRGHMAIVRDVNNEGEGDPFYEVRGIITLEDIIEEMLGADILDETDVDVDVDGGAVFPGVSSHQGVTLSRLSLLNASATNKSLTREEAMAVVAHLSANVPQFASLDKETISTIVMASPVVDIWKHGSPQSGRSVKSIKSVGGSVPGSGSGSQHSDGECTEATLYRRGKIAVHSTLVLTGRVEVLAGKDEFRSDAGPWSVLAADAVVNHPGTYRPDFTARVVTDHARILQITPHAFQAAGATVDGGDLLI